MIAFGKKPHQHGEAEKKGWGEGDQVPQCLGQGHFKPHGQLGGLLSSSRYPGMGDAACDLNIPVNSCHIKPLLTSLYQPLLTG